MHNYQHSQYWLGNVDIDNRILKLSKIKNAISSFIKIIAGDNIIIRYQSNIENKSNEIILSSNVDKNIDLSVGLAIHDALHIKYTDKEIKNNIKNLLLKNNEEKIIPFINEFSLLFHFFEDKRIDQCGYDSYPGYRVYIQTVYNYYYHNDTISQIFINDEYKEEIFENYLIKIINITHPNRDLLSLKGLKYIYDLIDIEHININYHSTEDIFYFTVKIWNSILSYANIKEEKPIEKDKKLSQVLVNQENLINHKIKKTKLNKTEEQQIDSINSFSELNKATVSNKKIDVIIYDNFNIDFINKKSINIINPEVNESSIIAINEGKQLGKLLADKLLLKQYNDIKYDRLLSGKIDGRLIANLGYNNEQVFYKTYQQEEKEFNLILSIDISSSMANEKFYKCLKIVTSFAVLSSIYKNIHVSINFRFANLFDRQLFPCLLLAYDSTKDSIIKISNLFPYIECSGVTPEGLCFEAISSHIIFSKNNYNKNIFINFSDGEPFFETDQFKYSKQLAFDHTKQQIENFKLNKIEIISYLITDIYNIDVINNFKYMYGDSAHCINVEQLDTIANSLNNKLKY